MWVGHVLDHVPDDMIIGLVTTVLKRYCKWLTKQKRSKQYGLQYDQDKPGDGYIVSGTYAKTRDPSKKLDV